VLSGVERSALPRACLLPNQIGEFYIQNATQVCGCANLQACTIADYFPFDSFLGDFAVSTASSSFAEVGGGAAWPLMISVAVTFLPYRSLFRSPAGPSDDPSRETPANTPCALK